MSAETIAPHDSAAEEAVLGAALQDQDAAHLLVETLRPFDFFSDVNRTIFRAINGAVDANEHIDLVTVGSALRAAGQLRDGMAADLDRSR